MRRPTDNKYWAHCAGCELVWGWSILPPQRHQWVQVTSASVLDDYWKWIETEGAIPYE